MLNSVARWLSATHVKSPRADTDGVERGGGGESVDCARWYPDFWETRAEIVICIGK